MSKYYIDIDYREHKIIELLKEKQIDKTINETIYNVVNLPIGDFIIKNNEDTVFIIERKSINDLSSSISDNRFREQKDRLFESTQDSSKIIYIIENVKNINSRMPKSTIDSAILNLIFKHKFNVIFTESPSHTLSQILLLYNKIKNNDFITTQKPIKLIKKNNNFNCFTNMLSVIPGVSMQIANKIAIKYKTFPNLISEFSKCEHPEKLLNSIQITDKRKIGNVLSKKIYNNISTEFIQNNEQEHFIEQDHTENTTNDIDSFICKI